MKDPDWLEMHRKRSRAYMKKYYAKYPEKYKSYRPNSKSKKAGFNSHHWSYLPEHINDLIELTVEQHIMAHKHLVYDQGSKMYKTTDGYLLNTKEKHEQYLSKILESQMPLEAKPEGGKTLQQGLMPLTR